jgi:hypothetical protein
MKDNITSASKQTNWNIICKELKVKNGLVFQLMLRNLGSELTPRNAKRSWRAVTKSYARSCQVSLSLTTGVGKEG